MIITRTMDTLDFQLGDSRRVSIDVAQVASAALSIQRRADGKLAPSLDVVMGCQLSAQRIEASLEQLVAMHARIVELMQVSSGPLASVAASPAASAEHFPY